MSNDGVDTRSDGALPAEYERLERAVRRLLDDVAGYRARAQVAEAHSVEMERALREVQSGGLDPLQLRETVRALKEENRTLRTRMSEAQERIQKLIARFDFLREEL